MAATEPRLLVIPSTAWGTLLRAANDLDTTRIDLPHEWLSHEDRRLCVVALLRAILFPGHVVEGQPAPDPVSDVPYWAALQRFTRHLAGSDPCTWEQKRPRAVVVERLRAAAMSPAVPS